MGNPPYSTSERTVLLSSFTLKEQRPKRWDLNPGPSNSESHSPFQPLKGMDFRWAPDWLRPQRFHYHWTGGRRLCMFLLSFRNPALIILFPQREVWWLPVAYGLTKIGEDIKAPPLLSVLLDENQADCFLFGGSRCEKPKAAGKPQMGENKKYSPDPLVRFCLEEPGVKAPGLSVGQRTRMFLPQELPSWISPPEERLRLPWASLEDLCCWQAGLCNSSEMKPS